MLYVVATPIGNLGDISSRAVDVLRNVSMIAAEDTRHTGQLLAHYGIRTRMIAYHDHNESGETPRLIAAMAAGESIALVSDAGTPLVSDPGYRLVTAAAAAGIKVSPVPGASALTAALSICALPVDRFCFEGFLPARPVARRERLSQLAGEQRTLVFYESPHRIGATLSDLAAAFGEERRVTIARELTKQYEQAWYGTLTGALQALERSDVPARGEFVLVLEGAPARASFNQEEVRAMEILLRELSPSAAATLGSELLGVPRKRLYEVALSLKKV